MDPIFRRAPLDSAPFPRGSFWTMWKDNARRLAEVEAGTPSLPALRLYRAEMVVVVDEDVCDQRVELIARQAYGSPAGIALPRLRDELRNAAEASARGRDCRWVRFTLPGTAERDGSWEGAMLYVGDEPINAQLLPETPGA